MTLAEATEHTGQMAALTLGLFFGAGLSAVARHWLGRRGLAQARTDALRSEHLATALCHMSNGLVIVGADGLIGLFNDRVREVFRLRPGEVATSMPWQEFIGNIGRHVGWDEERIGRVIANHVTWMGQTTVTQVEHNYDDGSVLSIHCRPLPDGGAVLTYDDVTEERQAQRRMAHMAFHDALTGLPNRSALRAEIDEAVRSATPAALLMIDLDGFKAVNDTLGHPVGDALLRHVAERLRACVGEQDMVARLGGDEFALLQAAPAPAEPPSLLAQRIIDALGAPYEVDGHHVVIGASVGVAFMPNDGESADQLLKSADMALYRAKADGRGTYRLFEPGMDARMQARRSLELDLRAALSHGEFEVHYQPLVSLHANRVSGFEALLRWTHPGRGRVSPADFIPLAEEIGQIGQIGAWVLRQACTDAAAWPDEVQLAVNLSPAQFTSRALVEDVMSALALSGLPARRLELEITETVMLQDTEATVATLHELRAFGVRIAMDDFGTGYSSLSYLRRFPFDRLKVDRSFTRDLPNGHDALAIVRAIVGLGASLGMATTVEGVETAEQLATLRAEGCTEVQGFLFSPARPAGEVAGLLASVLGMASGPGGEPVQAVA